MALPRAQSRHWNFYLAAAAGVVAAIATLLVAPDLFPAAAASVFSLTYLALTAHDMPKLSPDYLRDHAGDEDAPPWTVFVLTIAIVVYVVAALFIAVNDPSPNWLRLVLGGASVLFVWLMIHTMWGMHYAWEYHDAPEKDAGSKQRGGLEFAGDDEPDGMDFIYFAMVIAMTDQTSDTNITTRQMRRIVTGHSLFSYLFNTVIVAAAVNIVVQLGS
ncbi:MAG TPA: DUF1345 domain-containing protein [Hyphomicrobiaceae bacterium]|nr:DUF1345 domain-containing protein [Hyphomicrobiaceae bacterium]